MAHFAAVHKGSQEVMWTQNPHALGAEWECHKLSRAPTEFDEFDLKNARLKANPARKDKAARKALSLEERVASLEDQIARLMEPK